ncbi:hypothetical protein D9K79_16375 [Acinetobacter cumulans]|uniref:Uncharacterized protein n=1 Tax=Acinetobacter cumulans TaxID=2136182 RepID=A0ABX9U1Y5_9GAMM|nr:hypothetical protein [Acinetobacter cumulans]RLL38334.1 hypothetical protein D9K79_16375 [Acinetobacter cumulans]
MVQLIKKGGLRERANRSRSYKGSENTETTLQPNRYQASLTTEIPSHETITNETVVKESNTHVAQLAKVSKK